ncbi:lipase maturation factor family protein [Okibacterium endophyticum]
MEVAAWLGWFGWLDAGDYEIARLVLQRGTAAVFAIAFLSTAMQFRALLGENGLMPAPDLIARTPASAYPSLFRWRYSDRMLLAVAWTGFAIAALLVIGVPQLGPPWVPLVAFLLCWGLYLSVVNIGQTFYGFGWESLLLEAGFVVAFLGSNEVAPPLLVILFTRWLVFRLEFGAGMIKMRGGREWRDLTALMYHHETQPMPNPLSRFAHLLPAPVHKAEVLGNHFAQLVVPFFLFAPQPVASVAALIVIVTQLWLVITGNFAWLNWITIVLAFAGISDSFLHALFPFIPQDLGTDAASPVWWTILVALAVGLLVVLSWKPLRNLFARRQLMNASFNRWHLVNAYGAFGTVTKERYEVIVEGSDDERAGHDGEGVTWLEYEFKGKPGDPHRMPRQFAPYHLRLDWMMWFLALGARNESWFHVLLLKLLMADRATLRLLRVDPFEGAAPRWIRARLFRYRFTTRAERRQTGDWWVREPVAYLVRPVSLDPSHPR